MHHSESATVRFDLSHCLTSELEIDGTYYIDCKVHPAHIPVTGDIVWLDENDMCMIVKDKHMKKEVLRTLHPDGENVPPFIVERRIMNYCKYIGFNICCILKKL